jgi:tRNA(Arg) A34 adenosine deaminase TadA
MENTKLLNRLLTVIEQDILPKTRVGVAKGNKIFGAAILKKSDLSLIIAETNNEVENPLWHGEMHAIKKLYETSDRSALPDPKDCIFLATHEPCSLCLSAITWGGYDNFYYLFSHQDSRDKFNIPYDIVILNEVFGDTENNRPLYNRINSFWHSYNIVEMINSLENCNDDRQMLLSRMNKLTILYAELSNVYQTNKGKAEIPLA